MTLKVNEAKQLPQIVVRDNKGNVLSVIHPGDVQVGFSGNPGDLILKGGLDINTEVIDIKNQNSNYRISNDDIALFFRNTSASTLTVTLPTPPRRKGQLHIVKDFQGTAASYNIIVTTADGSLIDGATSQNIQVNFGAIMFVWTGDAWVSLALGASGAGSVAPGGGSSGGGDPGATYLTLTNTGSLTKERVLTVSGSTGLQLTDAGANSTATLSLTNTGVTAGTYTDPVITVDAQGRTTFIYSNPIWKIHTGSVAYTGSVTRYIQYYSVEDRNGVNGDKGGFIFNVPYNVYQINIEAWGAGGGAWVAYTGLDAAGNGSGGAGGYISGTFSVTPGQSLFLKVGRRGGDGGSRGLVYGESGYGGAGAVGGGQGAQGHWTAHVPPNPGETVQDCGAGGGGASGFGSLIAAGGGGAGTGESGAPGGNGELGTAINANTSNTGGPADGGGGGGGGSPTGTGGAQVTPSYSQPWAGGGAGGTNAVVPGVSSFFTDLSAPSPYKPPGTGSINYISASALFYGAGVGYGFAEGHNYSIGRQATDGLISIEWYTTSATYSRTIVYTTSSVAIVSSEGEIDTIVPLEAKFYVSGSRGISHGSGSAISVFGGDTKVSGSFSALGGVTGSHTLLTDGRSYLVGGANIGILSASDGQVFISNTAAADIFASYLLLSSTGSLSSSRRFSVSGSSGLLLNDSGSVAALSINDNIVATVSGTRFTGPVSASAGLSGSLQRINASLTYLAAGANISIVTASNGQVTISANTGSAFFDETATYITLNNTSSLANERVLSVSGSTGLKLVDNGPNSTVVLSINDNIVATVSGTRFTGNVIATAGLTGSLQQTSSGISYLVAGANMTIVTGSNGQITISNVPNNTAVTGTWRDAVNVLITTGAVSIDTGNRLPTSQGSDVFFWVSGSKSAGSGVSLFGGDLVSSGTIKAFNGLSGSLQRLATGETYLVAGANVTITSGSNGQVTINSSGGSGGSGDPDASYIVLSLTGSLNKERVLTVSGATGLKLVDSGENNNVTLSINDNIVATVSGTVFTGPVSASAGLSGSLQKIGPNLSYLVAGSNVIITTASNGQVNISAQFTITGSTTPYQFPIFHGTVSTPAASSSKYSAGMCYYDPTKVPTGNKTWYFRSIISPSTGSTIAYLELYDYNGIVSSPPIPIESSIVTASNASNFVYFEKNISNAMSGVVTPGIIEARMWCSPTGSSLEAILKNAKIDIEFS